MEKLTIAQIKKMLTEEISSEQLAELKLDERKGVQLVIKSYEKRLKKIENEKLEFQNRLKIERDLWDKGIEYIAGVDEVGRGPLAGSVVTAAVILPHDFDVFEVNDSKQLSEKKREELYKKILEKAVAVSVGLSDNNLIDEVNIYEATRLAMKQAIESLNITPQKIIVDAMTIDTKIPQLRLIKGDAKSASVAAASIVAKVTRDHLMQFYARIYPGYGFEKNDGYGTKQHLEGLENKGVTPIHRQSFEPVKKILLK